MSWMVPSVVVVVSTLVLTLKYCYVYLQRREQHVRMWALGWGICLLKSVIDSSLLSGESAGLLAVGRMLFLVAGLFFLWGACAFTGKAQPGWLVYAAAACSIWAAAGFIYNSPGSLHNLPLQACTVIVYAWAGAVYLRFPNVRGPVRSVTGWAIILLGCSSVWPGHWGNIAGELLKLSYAIANILLYCETAHKNLDQRINYLNALISNMNEVFLTYDSDARITFANRKSEELMGYSPEELKGMPVYELVLEVDREKVMEGIRDRLTRGKPGIYEVSFRHRDGSTRHIKLNASPIVNEKGEITGGLVLAEDITERKRMEEELSLQKAYFQQLFKNSPEGIVMLDNTDLIIDANKGFENLFQYSAGEIRGRYINDIIVPEEYAEQASALSGTVIGGESVHKESVRKRKDGSLVNVSLLGYPIVFSNKQVGVYGIYSDITERKKAEEQLKYLSLHDSLTGLYNRAYFEQEMNRLEWGRQFPVSIMICDVDGLKLVNDTLGHKAGDSLLVAAAGVIRQSFRGEDMVSRIGGDEFAVLLPQCGRTSVERAGNRLQEGLSRYNEANPELPLSISVGFATGGDSSVSLTDLFKEADNNMYREKLHRSQSARSAIVQTLMKALEARDYITEGHGERLQHLVESLARAIGLSDRSVVDLRLLAQFHDIGKVGIPDRILFKAGPLTRAEYAEMHRHCEIGHRIAKSAPDLAPIADWILKHHEWWNGEGYPLGLKKEEIPLECRILAIADAYDAMTSERPYRKAMTRLEAVEELGRCAGTQFDPQLVPVFVNMLKAGEKQPAQETAG